jgi:PAS domain S-box-containing protein
MTRSPMTAYGVALAAVIAAVVVRLLLGPLLGDRLPFVTLFLAVAFAAWYGGRGPALLALVTGAVAVALLVLEPRYTFAVGQIEYQVGLALYAAVGVGSIVMFEALHNSRRRAEEEVAARRVAERALAEREALLRITLSSIGDAVITTDASGNVTFLNAVAQQLTGWSQADASGQPLTRIFHIVNEDTRQPVENPALRALKEGTVVGLANHTILIARDGTERPIDDSAAPIRDENGAVAGAVLVFRDISERHRADKALHRDEERFRLAADAVNGIIYDADLLTGHVERTRGLYEVLGYRPDEVPPTAAWWAEQIHPDDRERVTHVDPTAVRTDAAVVEYRVRHKDGRWLQVEDRGVQVWDGGKAVRLVGCTTDITERKQAEESLRFQLGLTRSITDNATTPIFMMDDRSRCTFMNPAAEQMTGFTFGEVEGGILHDFIHHHRPDGRPYPMPECPIDRALPEHDEVRDHEDVFFRKDGEKFPVLCNARVIDKEGKAVGTVIEVRDVTKEKEAAEALRMLAADLSEADRRKNEFLATLAHELRNPLAPIRNGLQLIRLADGDLAAVGQAREMMERQVEQMVRLVDDLMDVSRISRGKIELRKQHVRLAEVVNSAVETSRPLIEQMGHELTVTLPTHPIVIDADLTRLAQVFMNLLNNSAKYSDRNGHIWLTAERQGSDVVVSVRDTGIGIPTDKLTSIFDLFSQVDRSLEKSQGGLGIGLNIVKRLVEMHDGRIEVKSDGPGRGSEFVVRLPVIVEESVPPPAERDEPSVPKSSLRIQIVDDNMDGADSVVVQSLLNLAFSEQVRFRY